MAIADTTGLARVTAASYPIDIRVTVPFLPRPFFVTLVVGRERRAPARLREERRRHPLMTAGNIAAATVGWSVLTIAALFATMVIGTL